MIKVRLSKTKIFLILVLVLIGFGNYKTYLDKNKIGKIPIGEDGFYYKNSWGNVFYYNAGGGLFPTGPSFVMIIGADSKTFEAIDCEGYRTREPLINCEIAFAKDKKRVYQWGKPIPGVDSASFRFVNSYGGCRLNEPCFMDKNFFYTKNSELEFVPMEQ